jgi:hypothetical protein
MPPCDGGRAIGSVGSECHRRRPPGWGSTRPIPQTSADVDSILLSSLPDELHDVDPSRPSAPDNELQAISRR